VFSVRIGLLAGGYPLASVLDQVLTGFALCAAIGLGLVARAWLVRAESATLREQIETACRGLFLQCTEAGAGDFRLTAKTGVWHLRTFALSHRMQLVLLPRPGGPGKMSLLLQWLSKQYPGPVPRVRISFNKE
jgi:hypothetical protein